MSFLNAIAQVASIAAPVLAGVLRQAISPEESSTESLPSTQIGPITYFFKDKKLMVANTGPDEMTLAYSRTERVTDQDAVATKFIPLEGLDQCSATDDVSAFADGNVSVIGTDDDPSSSDGRGKTEAQTRPARFMFSLRTLTVSTFPFFDGRFRFTQTKSGFRITSEMPFNMAKLRFKGKNGRLFELELEAETPTEAFASNPSGSDVRLPLDDVEITMVLPRNTFDELAKPVREQRQITKLDPKDLPF